jgi:hypothetical protein
MLHGFCDAHIVWSSTAWRDSSMHGTTFWRGADATQVSRLRIAQHSFGALNKAN